MTIVYNTVKFQYEVLLGSLLYSVHRDRHDAELSMNEYRQHMRVGRA